MQLARLSYRSLALRPCPWALRAPAARALAAAPAPAPLRHYEEESLLSITDHMMEGTTMQFEPIYRVLLHYTNWVNPKEIARKVHQAVPVVSSSHALRTVENAAAHGTAIVVTAALDDAELYEARLTRVGLKASLEVA
jgi:ATP-dependent Clp protease adapter protein ClpS